MPIVNYIDHIYHANLAVLEILTLTKVIKWVNLDNEIQVPGVYKIPKESLAESEDIKQDWEPLLNGIKWYYETHEMVEEMDKIMKEIDALKKELENRKE